MTTTESFRAAIVASVLCLLVSACASNAPAGAQPSDADPWEPLNRQIHTFNSKLDNVTLKPIAKGYNKVIPEAVRHRVTDFSMNLRGPMHIINNFLQGKGRAGFTETGRFLTNSTLGIGGLFDVATKFGMEAHPEDFGQTFAVWGVPSGPYVIVPFLGPQTLRDALSLPLGFLADPLFHYENDPVRYTVYGIRAVNLRARLLPVEDFVEDSFDRYIALRESYLQHREFEIYDGNPPEDEDFYEDFPEPE
jgi:phospholipid-binding lipoprotein MlaA